MIKPSGVAYETMKADDMVVVDMSGRVVEGSIAHLPTPRRISNSTVVTRRLAALSIPTPLMLPHGRRRAGDPGVRHYARRLLLWRHPCTRGLSEEEVQGEYELNTGKVIIETLGDAEPLHTPGIVVYQHGPFAWGKMLTMRCITR